MNDSLKSVHLIEMEKQQREVRDQERKPPTAAAPIGGAAPPIRKPMSEQAEARANALITALDRRIQKSNLRDELAKELKQEAAGPKIPTLTSKNVQRYIGAVAAAVKRGEIDGPKANAMLYAAQLLLAAERMQGQPAKRGRPPKTIQGGS